MQTSVASNAARLLRGARTDLLAGGAPSSVNLKSHLKVYVTSFLGITANLDSNPSLKEK